MRKEWKKAKLWMKMFLLLPVAYISAVRVRKKDFGLRFEVARQWAFILLRMTKTRLEIKGQENFPKEDGNLLVCNHQGSMDAFVLFGAIDVPFTAVGKVQGAKIPILGRWYKVMEMVLFDRDSAKDSIRMVRETAEVIKKGRNVLIFPEGTRSKRAEMGEFKAGALKPAFLAKCPIVPIALIDSYKVLDEPGGNRFIVGVSIGKPMLYDEYEGMTTQEVADRIKQQIQTMMDKKEG